MYFALVSAILASLISWVLPVEVVQFWALERAEADAYKRFEAVGRAEIWCWLIRIVMPIVSVAALILVRNLQCTADFLSRALAGWRKLTRIEGDCGRPIGWRTIGIRGFCVVWGLLALGHAGQAVQDTMTNWPYYRFRSGSQVLPNISDSNRDVIRYLLEVTKPDSRIFVASDQKLYFLSYYLLPRRLYYQVHPDAEFVVAQPFQQRRMEAYSLSEIDPATINRIHPDYILEYFEHPDLVDRSRLQDDQTWLSFYQKAHHDSGAAPSYLVCLRRVEKENGR